jgi:hypothetical protein
MSKSVYSMINLFRLIILLIGFGFSIANTKPTYAKNECFGDTCLGKDPMVFNCANDAKTLESKIIPLAKKSSVELRFSKKCNAIWSRVINRNSRYMPYTTAGINYPGGGRQSTSSKYRLTTWTNMLPVRDGQAQACALLSSTPKSTKAFVCTLFHSFVSNNATQQYSDLQKNKQLWQKQNPTHYTFSIQPECFCDQAWLIPMRFEIKNGKVVNMSSDNQPMPASSQWMEFINRHNTVEKVFGIIETALNDKAEKLIVIYDEKLGYPKSVYIDRVLGIADDELAYRILKVELQTTN